jgi:predicted esterase
MTTRFIIPFLVLTLLAASSASSAHALQSAEPTARELADQFDAAYQSEDWDRAIASAEQFAATDPGAVIGAYNAACAHARAGNTDQAADWLIRCAERGFAGIRSLEEDADLASIRDSDKFREALELVRANAAKRFEQYKAAAQADKPLTIVPDDLDADEMPPLLIVLHGSGGTPEPLAELYEHTASKLGMILVVPSALRPWGAGFGWIYRDESEWRVLDLIERFEQSHNIDTSRVYLAGFSQGANVTLAVGLKHPSKFAGLFPVCGHYEPDVMPIRESESRPPIYLMIGARDPFAHTFREAVRPLKDAGFPVRLRVLQGVAHEYPKRADSELLKGFKYLIRESASD